MPIKPAAHVCAVVLILTTAAGAQQRPSLGTIARDRAAQASSATVGVATEQEWIVGEVTTAVQQMVAYATRSKLAEGVVRVKTAPGAAGSVAFDVQPLGGDPLIISITDHIWAPGAYAQLASSLAGGGESCSAHPTAPVIAALLNPRAAVMLRESERISVRLKGDMRCGDAHNEAALLLGAFALREAAGAFSDTRRVLSRISAHLAIAEAIERGTARSEVRQLADAVLLTLVGRQRSALAALDRLEAGRPSAEVHAWVRALRLRNTSDWRIITGGKDATLLEQLAIVRAYKTSLGNTPTLDFFYTIENPAEIVDWARLLMQINPNVEAGNRFSEYWISAELEEAADVLNAFDPAKKIADREALARELNAEPAPSPIGPNGAITVIDWGTWAAAGQRHLLTAVFARHRHLANSLGLPGDARAFRDEALRVTAGLKLYALGAVAIAYGRDEVAKAFAKAGPLVQSRPELVTDGVWRIIQTYAKWAVVPPPGDPKPWFTPMFPAGTVFDVDSRSQPDDKEPRFTAAQIAELRKQAPYSRRLAQESVRWQGDKPLYDVLKREYLLMAPYDLEFTTAMAKAAWDKPDIYVSHMEAACRMSAEGYWDLAPYLADHGRIAEARHAYESWLESGKAVVAMSTSMLWLVRHYFETGDHVRALAVAERVADVGSYWGLVTRANLHDWNGELEAAERVHRHARQRYDNPNELLAFYLRHGRKGPEVDELMQEVFPAGLTRPGTPATATPPRDGVVIVFAGMTGSKQGLKADDVITAVDGIRVRNMAQYRAVRGASPEQTIRFTVWRGGKYIEVPARLRHGWVVSSLKTYDPSTAAK